MQPSASMPSQNIVHSDYMSGAEALTKLAVNAAENFDADRPPAEY